MVAEHQECWLGSFEIFDSYCTCRIYEHQRHSLTVYLSENFRFHAHSFVGIFFFYLLCLTYFTEMGAGSRLSVLKEAKTNYMGWFIFSRGGGGGGLGVHLLILFFLFFAYSYVQNMHNTSAATFNIKAIILSLK